MYSGREIHDLLTELGFTHVVWVPDSTIGQWEPALSQSDSLKLIRVCREGEAWWVAAGLFLGGATPIVLVQCTGLFESGDALRVALHDYKLPLVSIIGYRSYLNQETLPGDSCLQFTEPILQAWQIPYQFIDAPEKFDLIRSSCLAWRDARVAGAILLAEGRA
jgi:sulfopyruvate decarboxylase subunit alpha